MTKENNFLEKDLHKIQKLKNYLKSIEEIVEPYFKIEDFDFEEKPFEFQSQEANDFFSKCQELRKVDDRLCTRFKKRYGEFILKFN